MTYLATIQAFQQIQIGRIRYSAMYNKNPVVYDCSQRKPSVYFLDKFQ